ncbi:hypothetical protein GCM10025751_46080 [Haladaptatus pallidirubidus]|uniref:Uncharacterized protein n=1 Tax=Haladaptatus pallidirubidus TaxID=1008152 RepID=A0AAV3UPK2_9EURY
MTKTVTRDEASSREQAAYFGVGGNRFGVSTEPNKANDDSAKVRAVQRKIRWTVHHRRRCKGKTGQTRGSIDLQYRQLEAEEDEGL